MYASFRSASKVGLETAVFLRELVEAGVFSTDLLSLLGKMLLLPLFGKTLLPETFSLFGAELLRYSPCFIDFCQIMPARTRTIRKTPPPMPATPADDMPFAFFAAARVFSPSVAVLTIPTIAPAVMDAASSVMAVVAVAEVDVSLAVVELTVADVEVIVAVVLVCVAVVDVAVAVVLVPVAVVEVSVADVELAVSVVLVSVAVVELTVADVEVIVAVVLVSVTDVVTVVGSWHRTTLTLSSSVVMATRPSVQVQLS